jgi:hypothetical protein
MPAVGLAAGASATAVLAAGPPTGAGGAMTGDEMDGNGMEAEASDVEADGEVAVVHASSTQR